MTWNRDIEAEAEAEAERRTTLMDCAWAEDNHLETDSTNMSSAPGFCLVSFATLVLDVFVRHSVLFCRS